MRLPISDAGDEQVLADVSQSSVAGSIGVVAEDRDPGGERLVRRTVERLQVDEAHRDAVHLGADGAVHRVDHLAHVGALRAGPLVLAAEQLAGVLRAVLRRDEERVGGHVVDERELELLLLAEDPGPTRRVLGVGIRRRAVVVVASSAGLQDDGRQSRRATGQGGAARHVQPALVLLAQVVALLAIAELEALDDLVGGIVVSPIDRLPVCHLMLPSLPLAGPRRGSRPSTTGAAMNVRAAQHDPSGRRSSRHPAPGAPRTDAPVASLSTAVDCYRSHLAVSSAAERAVNSLGDR